MNGKFLIDATVQSQYASSPHIRALVDSFWEAINPEADIDKIYNKMVDPDTSEGFGLDVWGRIVAIGREYISVDEQFKYLGFKGNVGAVNSRLSSFNNAPFYRAVSGKVRLADSAYRTYIFIKAMINLGDSTLASINRMLAYMFPDTKIFCIHVDTMTLRLVVKGKLSAASKRALLNLPWLPAGVGLQFYQVVTPTLGFNGSRLEPFNCGTFATHKITDI